MRDALDLPLSFATLRRAIEAADVAAMLGCYADDALLTVVGSDPSMPPFQLRGVAELAKHFRAAFSRPATRILGQTAVEGNEMRFVEECRYADGGAVRVATTLRVVNGLIVEQTDHVGTFYPGDGAVAGDPSSADRANNVAAAWVDDWRAGLDTVPDQAGVAEEQGIGVQGPQHLR